MEKDNNQRRLTNADRFWDLDYTVPKKSSKPFSADTAAVDVEVGASENGIEIPEEKIPGRQDKAARLNMGRAIIAAGGGKDAFEENEKESESESDEICTLEEYEYIPDNPLLLKVKVRGWPSRYTFFKQFRDDAKRLFDISSSECRHEPYFSYMPQYVQLNDAQRRWYLYWRENMRNGVYLHTDYSYVLLYAYEIINISDVIGIEKGARLLAELWREARKDHPRIGRYLSAWLCDYCLVNNSALPVDLIKDFYRDALKYAPFKEYYMGFICSKEAAPARLVLEYGSNYNWKTSKFINEENRELFGKLMKNAFVYVFTQKKYSFGAEKYLKKANITLNAYNGALCAYDVKRIADIEYYTVNKSVDMRINVTYLVKYIENNIRYLLGIKNRFIVTGILPEMKKACDEFFAPMRDAVKKRQNAGESEQEYEKFYEAESTGFSTERASDIEKKAWDTTSLLVTAFEDELGGLIEPGADDDASEDTAPIPDETDDLIKSAIGCLLEGNSSGFVSLAKSKGIMPDALAEKVNEALYDDIGDAVVINDGADYIVISDYAEDVETWMNR